jgi:AcrR family transcriptional regulator
MGSEIRERILDEATNLFAHKGYSGTSMREVAEAVGCTKPALYYHYKSKADLFVAAITAVMSFHNETLKTMLIQDTPVRERLKMGIQVYINNVQTHPAAMKLLITAQHAPESKGTPKVDILSIHEAQRSMLKSLLKEGIRRGEIRPGFDVEPLSVSLIGLINIWGMCSLLGQPVPDHVSDHILDIFFHGVAPS